MNYTDNWRWCRCATHTSRHSLSFSLTHKHCLILSSSVKPPLHRQFFCFDDALSTGSSSHSRRYLLWCSCSRQSRGNGCCSCCPNRTGSRSYRIEIETREGHSGRRREEDRWDCRTICRRGQVGYWIMDRSPSRSIDHCRIMMTN